MSSMWRSAVILPALLAAATSGSAQYAAPAAPAPAYAYAASANTAAWLNNWRTLRQSSNYRFSDYAGLLIANPDWPDAAKMRGWAEKAMQPGENSATVIAFFTRDKPETGTGWARLADAYAAERSHGRGARRGPQCVGVSRSFRNRRAGHLGALWRELHAGRPRPPGRCPAVRQEGR